jgi:putative transcriptional regulator
VKKSIILDSVGPGKTDWERLRNMTDEQAYQNALDDPDNQPLDVDQLSRMPGVPRVKIIRRALGMTQEAFAERYLIPLGTLRDWEQARTEPDQAAQAYLKVIAREPETVARALGTLRAA